MLKVLHVYLTEYSGEEWHFIIWETWQADFFLAELYNACALEVGGWSVVNVREEVVHMMWAFRDYTTVTLVCATPHERNQLVTFTWWQWDQIQSNPWLMNNTCKHSLCDSPGDSYEMFEHLSSRPGAIADGPAMACSFLTVPRMVVINKRISSSAERLGRVWELSVEPLRLMYHHCLVAHTEWITNQLFSSLSKSEQSAVGNCQRVHAMIAKRTTSLQNC